MGPRACSDAGCGLCGPLDSGSALPWERHSVRERGKEGKVGAVGKGPTRLRLPCRTCTVQITYAMGSARNEKGKRPKGRKQWQSVARSVVRRVLQATVELLRCTGWNAVVDMVAASFVRSPLLMTTLLMDHIQMIRIIRMLRLWAAKEILERWWASLFSSILLSSTTLDVGFGDHNEASPGMS